MPDVNLCAGIVAMCGIAGGPLLAILNVLFVCGTYHSIALQLVACKYGVITMAAILLYARKSTQPRLFPNENMLERLWDLFAVGGYCYGRIRKGAHCGIPARDAHRHLDDRHSHPAGVSTDQDGSVSFSGTWEQSFV
ncbi:unnamed protein product [Vitrella brassicaformis CCMP3155]|uniref:Uncharacterized protein n=1 Tax=Vitrella brassicaformis (strain CCMP3155) TaxID=1169540 RepID=A0A0G4FYP0_VITBC|nr:unnamed protein product [Vitrella brassicaformis CCMP3155]|eukprot:CEM20497.1 unnamed protein product [Vitrella brassicaformis CCMP3155]